MMAESAVFHNTERKSTLYNGSTFTHLRPLSIYAHMVCLKQCNPSSPLCNIQVQITSGNRYKRPLEDSCLDETCETPLKKPCLYKSCSPDQGCVVDSLDLTGVQGSTPKQTLIISKDFTPPRPKVTQAVTPVSSTPLSQCTQNSLDQARESLPSPIPVLNWNRDLPSNKIALCSSLKLDYNSVSVNLTGSLASGNGVVREVSSVLPSVTPEVATAETTKEKGGVSVDQQAKSELEVSTLNEETTESFESTLPLQVQVKSKVVVPQTKTVCQSAEVQSRRRPECEINRRTHNPVLSSLASGNGVVREVSSVLPSVTPEVATAETAVTTQEKGGVSVDQQAKSELEVSTLNEETTESFESTLPLQVQVKSKVVVPQTKTVCQSAEVQSRRRPECEINRRTHNPVLSEEALQRQKTAYVESVKRHMQEGNRARNGVMTELHHLMNTVAGQQSGSNREHWQHPSDLTRRNYRSRGPLLSLSEWQKRNYLAHRRFARVPDIFYRSPVF